MESVQKELIEELLVIETMLKENPCGMEKGLIKALKEVAHSFIGKQCLEGASREQVAKYLQRDVRTLSRWKQEYDDFPTPILSPGKKEVTYNWMDIVHWKLAHKEIYS